MDVILGKKAIIAHISIGHGIVADCLHTFGVLKGIAASA